MAGYIAQQGNAGQQSAQVVAKGPSPPEGFDVVHCIGEGTYGRVFLAKTKAGKCVAIKTLKAVKEGEGISLTAIREAMLLKELHHVNILHLESVHLNRLDASLSLAFEFADYDLYEMIIHHRTNLKNAKPHVQHFPPVMVKSIMWQLLNGLSYLHQNWIIHRDLKPSNLLLMGQGASLGQLKIADFGLARVFRSPSRPLSDNGVVVTIWYRAPELLLGARHYTGGVDVWAAACIFGELLTLKPLFHGQEVRTPLDAFQRNQLDQIFSILGHPSARQWPDIALMPHWSADTQNIRTPLPEHKYQLEAHLMKLNPTLQQDPGRHAAFDLMKRMLEFDPKKRITAAEALQHDYFTQDPKPSLNAFPASLKVKYTGKMQEETAPKQRPQPAVAPKRPMPQKRTAVGPPGRGLLPNNKRQHQ